MRRLDAAFLNAHLKQNTTIYSGKGHPSKSAVKPAHSKNLQTCILISSCEKYRPLAEWTGERIGRLWSDHPPIFFSGLRGNETHHLPLRSNERDWMSVTLDAVSDLLNQGFSHAYLILDDLPPLGICNASYLNENLPATAERLDATFLGLLGYGQHRPPEGTILGADNLHLEHCPPTYRWKFSLHPGLWNLARMKEILAARIEHYAESERTPWNFERHVDGCSGPIPVAYLKSCYRVNGCHYEKGRLKPARRAIQSLALFLCDALLFQARVVGGGTARERRALQLLWPYCYYRGPYPIFWSGVMRQGGPSPEFDRFTRALPFTPLSKEWNQLKQRLPTKA